MEFELILYPNRYAVCRLDSEISMPEWIDGEVFSISRNRNETSIVCEEHYVAQLTSIYPDARCEGGWRCLQVVGPLSFELIGVVSSLATCLAEANVGIFVISTFDTDLIFVKAAQLEDAIAALTLSGHRVLGESGSSTSA